VGKATLTIDPSIVARRVDAATDINTSHFRL
jgi:hypothetical protein